ncbi:Myeloid-associated differentiation marker-like protein 2 [Channa argus]|uniref:Myeloid-associated differentiation marker-like protein 2 n=1 Tax=Channa argus TaxID=215402 RepID=A0A6G1QPA2_CHAAH|nr:Myeloid-associated differentiation marker-like protein 2 [Channa argus]KAK2884861.1 hypothetical protein Q8A73_021335 [Channa argus]
MFGPFKGCQGILRLLEIIFSASSLIIVIFRNRMLTPWGVWCQFVWLFCITVPLVLSVVEDRMLHILLAAFLPDWADLTCGLTTLCAVMITSATIIFVVVFICLSCIIDFVCFIFSVVATVVFLVDSIQQKKSSAYLCGRRGVLRIAEAFLACIILTAATDQFVTAEWLFRPLGLIISITVFAVCLLVTLVIIVLRLLQHLLSFGLNVMEIVFNVLAVLLYLVAVILWPFFGYKRHQYDLYICGQCSNANLNTVTIGAIVNLVFYIVDLFFSIKSR